MFSILEENEDVEVWEFPYDRPDRPDRPNRPSRLQKNVQTTGTIIWKRYPDDRKRPGRFKIYTIVPIVRIELNSIQAIEVVSDDVIRDDWDDWDDPDDHMETRLKSTLCRTYF